MVRFHFCAKEDMFPIEIYESVERKKIMRRVILGGQSYGKYEVVSGGFRPSGSHAVIKAERDCIFSVLGRESSLAAARIAQLSHVGSSVAQYGTHLTRGKRPYVERGGAKYVGYET